MIRVLRLGWRINYKLIYSILDAPASPLELFLTHYLINAFWNHFSQELFQTYVFLKWHQMILTESIPCQNIPPYMRSVQELCYSWKSRRTLSFQKPLKMLRPTKCAQLSPEIAISNKLVFQFQKNDILSIARCSFAYHAYSQNQLKQNKVTIFIVLRIEYN